MTHGRIQKGVKGQLGGHLRIAEDVSLFKKEIWTSKMSLSIKLNGKRLSKESSTWCLNLF